MTQGHNVRLTTQAHRLCVERSKEAKTSMKAVASEAIFLTTRDKDKYEDPHALLLSLIRTKSELETEIKNLKRNAFSTLLFGCSISAFAGGCLGILLGGML